MTELTMQELDALRAQLPTDYDKLLNRMDELRADGTPIDNIGLVAMQEHYLERELALVNLALRKYGSHD